jgi:uncharacterized protein (DUF3820 family)
MNPLTNNDPMPFGTHRGLLMKDVPAKYLDWAIGQPWIDDFPSVKAYILANLERIHKEIDDDD